MLQLQPSVDSNTRILGFRLSIDSSVNLVKVKEYMVNGEAIPIFKLELIDLYNKYMNAVDLADQLRNEYRPDAKWWRNNKWWWSPFLPPGVMLDLYREHA